jgi:hypothetical protein
MPATMEAPASAPLTGQELLARQQELFGQPVTEIARACGYVAMRKVKDPETGEVIERECVTVSAFKDALLEASGVKLAPAAASGGNAGPRLSYRTSVLRQGGLVVGKGYVAQGEFMPGDEFAIRVGLNCIELVRVGDDGEPEVADYGDED